MSDFSQEIQNFRRHGTYTYRFDESGNLTFNSSSSDFNQVYLSFPLTNPVYDTSKLQTLYNLQFEEFVPPSDVPIASNVEDQLSIAQEENAALRFQLQSVIDNTDESEVAATQVAVRQVVLELRKAIGEGRVDSDFSDTFPYTPIKKDNA